MLARGQDGHFLAPADHEDFREGLEHQNCANIFKFCQIQLANWTKRVQSNLYLGTQSFFYLHLITRKEAVVPATSIARGKGRLIRRVGTLMFLVYHELNSAGHLHREDFLHPVHSA